LYWRILRLRHVRPNSWQRAAFFEGSLAVAAVLVLADLASAWLLIALPAAVALVVKAHDVFVGWLRPDRASTTSEVAFGGMSKPADDIVAYITGEKDVVAPEAIADKDAKPETSPKARTTSKPASKPRSARAAQPGAAVAPEPEPKPNVRGLPTTAPMPRAARARPGAAAARAQVSAAHSVSRRRAQPKPGDAKGRS
jgi:hypothetical protein